MAILEYNNVRIEGIAAAVPSRLIDNLHYSEFFTEKEAKSIIKMTGIAQRRFADYETCSSDLCYLAAESLISQKGIDKYSIDACIMVTLTPDYRMPATAFLLHNRLGLKKGCLALDISLGCSGYVYGLSLAFSLLQQVNIRRVLLLNGETKSKTYGARDKSTSLLFGDGGAATIIGKTEREMSTVVSLNSDGARYQAIIIPNGGYRNPTSVEGLTEIQDTEGNWRSKEQGIMNGPEIFDFTITEVPKDIILALEYSGFTSNDVDYFVFHQANRFITDHIGKKLRIDPSKIPYALDKFGNTASTSIPLTICSELNDVDLCNKKILMSAFGVGLSWGTVISDFNDCLVMPVKVLESRR